MIAVVFALLCAASNATGSILQRREARNMPQNMAFRPALIWALLHRPAWLGGVAALIAGFVFQATALSFGALALVQPLLAVELPLTMIGVSLVFKVTVDRRSWLATAALTGGLALFLLTAAPSGNGRAVISAGQWALAGGVTVLAMAALIATARALPPAARAAVLGTAAGIGFAFTATFMRKSTVILRDDPSALPTSWQLYAMVATGICSFFLLQNAYQSGPLIAAQPAITTSDPVASVLYGIMLFDEQLRSGVWIVPELAGIALVLYGSVLLARSPAIQHMGAGSPARPSPK
ncbi:DMT family transporter [Streptosporangium sp. NPDC051022]|uniref:DMT family transporter n=1 Tax=Streptosporangium sp. NPDC051022 TaxID=3155752 RepID=UPI003423E4A2